MRDLTGISVFAAVVEAGSFTAAARALGLSKSAVSKQVARLEDRLGARLLNRTTRRLSLTEVGRAFYERCQRIVAEAEEAELAVTTLQEQPRGVLRVNVPMSFGLLHIAPALPAFTERYPELKVDLTLNDRVIDVIEEGADLAIRIAEMPDSSLICRKLADARLVTCAAPSYLERCGRPASPADIAGHNCLVYSYLGRGNLWPFLDGDGGITEVPVDGTMKANNGDILHAVALSGIGLLRTPTFISGPDIRAGRLEMVLRDHEPPPRGIYAVYPHNRHLSTKVRLFVDHLVECFAPTPYWDEGLPARP
jgi:DNA-binding transcriptional LysR family regulator